MLEKRKIRSLLPETCPQCECERTLTIYEDKIMCRRCGYVYRRDGGQVVSPAEQAAQETPAPPQPSRQPLRATFGIQYGGTLIPRARAAFNSGQSFIHQKNYPEAIAAFKRAIDLQRDFFDCYYWIAMLSDDLTVKRQNLEKVIAYQPNHMEAVRELMLLDGKITPEQAAVMDNPFMEPIQMQAGGAVKVMTRNIRCPQCGAPTMGMDELSSMLVCAACGHAEKKPQGATGESSLIEALLERRTQPVKWLVGERLLQCNSCGAERTIPGEKLSDYCPYCGSTHVMVRDALGSFEQPDGVIPFTITRADAGACIKAQLNMPLAKVRAWFDNNAVERATLQGHFLPYWVFDAQVSIRRTYLQNEFDKFERYQRPRIGEIYRTETFPDAAFGVQVCGVKSPPKFLTEKMGPFNLQSVVAYEPALLSQNPAQIYSIDFDKASLDARGVIGQTMRTKHNINPGYSRIVNVFASIVQMSFQLLLMPVWIATLYEKDGEVRTALVNGQTGVVAFGRSQRPHQA